MAGPCPKDPTGPYPIARSIRKIGFWRRFFRREKQLMLGLNIQWLLLTLAFSNATFPPHGGQGSMKGMRLISGVLTGQRNDAGGVRAVAVARSWLWLSSRTE